MEAIREIDLNQVQLSELVQNLGEWGTRLFHDIVSILAAIAADDNRWDA